MSLNDVVLEYLNIFRSKETDPIATNIFVIFMEPLVSHIRHFVPEDLLTKFTSEDFYEAFSAFPPFPRKLDFVFSVESFVILKRSFVPEDLFTKVAR